MGFFKNLISNIRNDTVETEPKETVMELSDPLLSAIIAGENITRSMAMSIPVVSSSVRKITDIVSMVSFNLYRRVVDDSGKHTIQPVYRDHRLQLINYDTGDTLDAKQFLKALVKDYLLGRGGYAYINRGGNAILSLHYIPENKLTFFANSDPIFKSYSISLEGRRYYDHDFLKILRVTENGYSGTGVMSEISKALEAAYSSLVYMLKLTKTGGIKKGFINAEKELNPTQMNMLREAWRRLYTQGGENVIILNQGMKFQDAGQSPMDMQLMQIRNTLNADIEKAFGIEKDDEKTLKFTITPILQAIESALNRYLLLESEKETYFWAADTRELDKMDPVKRYTALATATRGGLMAINEARYKENMPEYPGLNLIPMSLGTTFFDIDNGMFYTPNTGQTGSASQGGE